MFSRKVDKKNYKDKNKIIKNYQTIKNEDLIKHNLFYFEKNVKIILFAKCLNLLGLVLTKILDWVA